MQKVFGKSLTTFAAGLTLAIGLTGLSIAHDGHDHGGATHGGADAKTKRHHFEVVFTNGGLTLYAHGPDHKALDASRIAATATFYHPSAPEKPWFRRELKPTPASPGKPADSLALAADLSKIPASGAKVAFQVTGLPDAAEPGASFIVPFAVAKSSGIEVAKATKADQAAIDKLKDCPVSHEDLNAMGGPLKVSLNGRSTFICCKACLKEIQANPGAFFGGAAAAPKGEHDGHDHNH